MVETFLTITREYLDEVSGGVFWPDAQIYDALNDAQLEVFGNLRVTSTSVALALASSTDMVTIPTAVMIPQYILGTTTTGTATGTVEYWPTSHARLEQYKRNWKAQPAGQPKEFILWDYSRLRVWPTPDINYTYSIVGVPWPTEITASVPDLTLPQELKNGIALRAVALLVEATMPWLADQALIDSNELLLTFKRQLRNRGGHNIRRLRPGTRFTQAQQGNIDIGKSYS